MASFLKRLLNRRKDPLILTGLEVGQAIVAMERHYIDTLTMSCISRNPGLRVQRGDQLCSILITVIMCNRVRLATLHVRGLATEDRDKFTDAVFRGTFNSHFSSVPPRRRTKLWEGYNAIVRGWRDEMAAFPNESDFLTAKLNAGLFENPTEETTDEVTKAVEALRKEFGLPSYAFNFLYDQAHKGK